MIEKLDSMNYLTYVFHMIWWGSLDRRYSTLRNISFWKWFSI